MGLLIGNVQEWRRELTGAVLVGVFFGLVGPFGTYFNDTVGMRIAFWVAMMVAGFLIYAPLLRLALILGARFGQPAWFTAPLAVLVIAAPVSLMSAVVVVGLWPKVGPHMRLIDWYGQAVVLGLPLCALALWSRRAFPSQSPAPPPAPAARSFLDRLPPRLGRTLLCLQMEDHYVRAYTERGSELILLPLKAAVAELGDEGLQVHRSWWVARTAVTSVVQDGRNLKLKLVNDLEAPVSRTSIAVLRQAGWLDEIRTPESNRRRTVESDS
jgi:LytTr DNA-binding domain